VEFPASVICPGSVFGLGVPRVAGKYFFSKVFLALFFQEVFLESHELLDGIEADSALLLQVPRPVFVGPHPVQHLEQVVDSHAFLLVGVLYVVDGPLGGAVWTVDAAGAVTAPRVAFLLWCVLGSLPALAPVFVSAGRATGGVAAVVNAHGLRAAAGRAAFFAWSARFLFARFLFLCARPAK